MTKRKLLKVDCDVCEGRGKEKLGEGLHRAICRQCQGSGEVALTQDQLDMINEYLKERAEGDTHSGAIITVAQNRAGRAEDRGEDWGEARDKAITELSRIVEKISIENMEEIRQFIAGLLKEIQGTF